MMSQRQSRRTILGAIVAVPVGTALARAIAVSAETQPPVPSTDNDQAFIERLAAAGRTMTVPHRANRPYRLTRPVKIAPGTRLLLENGVEFLFDPGERPIAATEPIGVFYLAGNDIAIVAERETRVRSSRPDPNLYAVMARGVQNVEIRNILGIDCAHAYVTAATEAYAELVPSGPLANISREVRIIGGGSEFQRFARGAGHGACVIAYCSDFTIKGCRYRNVSHGIQWWGGDSDPSKDGDLSKPRKCGPGAISGISVSNAEGASVWGSMGRDIIVADCNGNDAGDVGFDSEGGVNITFQRCTQMNAKAGCFAAFFENENIRFLDCIANQSSASQPVFRTYGTAAGDTRIGSRSITVIGGRFTCTDDQPGVFDNAFGAIDDLIIRSVTFDNVTLKLEYHPYRRISIVGNRIRQSTIDPAPIVTLGTTSSDADPPLVTVRDNDIQFRKPAGPQWQPIHVVRGDARQLKTDIAGNRTRVS